MTWADYLLLFLLAILAVYLSRRIERLESHRERPAGCTHPETENIGTFGLPRYRCVLCRQIVDLP